MIVGLGSDLCNIDRIQQSLDRFGERFIARVFTDVEQAKSTHREFLAKYSELGHVPANGESVVVGGWDFGRRVALSLGAEFQVNTYTTNSQDPVSVAFLPDGGFVVVLNELRAGTNEVFAQRFDAAGVKVGAKVEVA